MDIIKKIKKKLWTLRYKGNNVNCLICNAHYRVFRPYGIVKRKNAYCPNCHSLERNRMMYYFLTKFTSIFKNQKTIKILHFAPEPFFYKMFDAHQNFEYTPCDLFPERYNYKGSKKVVKVDITNMPFEDNYFDFIMCSHVLEHVPNDLKAMQELYRVLNNKGFAVLQVPIDINRTKTYEDFTIVDPLEREIAFGQHDHVRVYGLDYQDRLKSAGFIVEINNFVKSLKPKEVFKFGFDDKENIYVVKK